MNCLFVGRASQVRQYFAIIRGTQKFCEQNLLPAPNGGLKTCTTGNSLGSVCTFSCDRYHTMVGPLRSSCIETRNGPRWTHPPAVCDRDNCVPARESREDTVRVTCTDKNFVNSVCSFKCTRPGLVLCPHGTKTNTCLPSRKWDRPGSRCAPQCPPNAKMDVFLIIDGSDSIERLEWNLMKNFVREIISSFTASADGANFAAVTYSSKPHISSRIMLNDYSRDIGGLLRAIENLPQPREGTDTGLAIEYVLKEMMIVGNRPSFQDIVLLFTDGSSSRSVEEPSVAIRNHGALVIAVGIGNKIDDDELVQIAGSGDNVVFVQDFESLNGILLTQILEEICFHLCWTYENSLT